MRRRNFLIGVLIVWLFTLPTIGQAQFTKQDSVYFDSTLVDFQNWLASKKIGNVLKVKGLVFKPNRITIQLLASSKDDWIQLRTEYKDMFRKHIGKRLFNKMLFQMAVDKDSAVIEINTPSQDYPVLISFENNKVSVNEPLPQDIQLKGNLEIDLKNMTPLNGNRTTTQGSVEEVKHLIINYLKGHYEKKSVWWKKPKFEVIEYDNEVCLEVTNIKREILNDFLIGYYELILIDIFIEPKGNALEISYNVQGKYGSGIFVAPRRSGYKDLDAVYPEYMERYNKKFRSMLRSIINSRTLKN